MAKTRRPPPPPLPDELEVEADGFIRISQEELIVRIDSGKFWGLRPLHVDWIFILGKFLRTLEPKRADDILILQTAAGPLYVIRKTLARAEDIARITGLPRESLEALRTILNLGPLTVGWPQPTVDYWGEA